MKQTQKHIEGQKQVRSDKTEQKNQDAENMIQLLESRLLEKFSEEKEQKTKIVEIEDTKVIRVANGKMT